MPIYEFRCHECGTVEEVYLKMEDRAKSRACPRGHRTERIYSVPAVSIWDASRPFPNAVRSGPGTFPTKTAYESHLKANDMAETSTSGKIYRPHGSKVVRVSP